MTASSPSEPWIERQQVVARAVERVAAELDDLAGDEHAAHATDVVHGQPVLEAVHAAGVLADVAADRAGDLRRRIGRVVEAVGAQRRPKSRGCARRVARPPCTPPGRSRRCGETSPSRRRRRRLSRQRAAGQARPGAARDNGHAGRMAAAQHFDELRFVFGNRDGRGQLAIHREAVALVGPRLLGRSQQRGRRQDRCELGVDGRIEHRSVRGPRSALERRLADYSTSALPPGVAARPSRKTTASSARLYTRAGVP